MSTSAIFANNVDVSGQVDVSGNTSVEQNALIDGSFNLHGLEIPKPVSGTTGVLTMNSDNSNILEWIAPTNTGGSGTTSNFYENISTDAATSSGLSTSTSGLYSRLYSTLGV